MWCSLRSSNRHLLKISKVWLIRLQVSLLEVPSERKPRRAFITVRSGSVIHGLIQDWKVFQRFTVTPQSQKRCIGVSSYFYMDCKVANQQLHCKELFVKKEYIVQFFVLERPCIKPCCCWPGYEKYFRPDIFIQMIIFFIPVLNWYCCFDCIYYSTYTERRLVSENCRRVGGASEVAVMMSTGMRTFFSLGLRKISGQYIRVSFRKNVCNRKKQFLVRKYLN